MNLFSELVAIGQLWFFNLMLLPVFYFIYKNLPWEALINNKNLQHRFLAATVLLVIVWRININLDLGIIIHFLGMTTITLIFGWPLAMISAFLAQVGFVLTDADKLDTLALNFVLNGVIPAWFTWRFHLFIESYKPINPFVYIMVTGFLSCLFSSILVSLIAILILWTGGKYSFHISVADYLGYLPLFIFPEAVINGMLISGLSVLHPQWVMSFDDKRYFQEPAVELEEQNTDQNSINEERVIEDDSIKDNTPYHPPKGYYDSLNDGEDALSQKEPTKDTNQEDRQK